MRSAYKIYIGKTEGKGTFGRLSRRWRYNIKTIILHEVL
jgi:hypothetical protein